jgi:hypothetical protein
MTHHRDKTPRSIRFLVVPNHTGTILFGLRRGNGWLGKHTPFIWARRFHRDLDWFLLSLMPLTLAEEVSQRWK